MRKVLDNVIVRLSAHYVALLALYHFSLRAIPWLPAAIERERSRGITRDMLGVSSDVVLPTLPPANDIEVLGLVVLLLVGSLGVAFPVALVYQWTSEPEEYRRDFGRALVVLPIVVALAVFVVKGNLALAFCLGGIVAVVRWRATLRDPMDGAFMFVMIGIGLAAGVQLLLVSLVGSVVFNLVVLILARAKFARRPRQVEGWVLAPPADLVPDKGKQLVAIRIDTTNQALVEARLAAILPLCAKEWEQSAVAPLPNGGVRLEYQVTLKKKTTPDSLLSTIASFGMPEIVDVGLAADSSKPVTSSPRPGGEPIRAKPLDH